MHKSLNAYTTLEIIVVIGIMVLVTGMVIPVSLRQTKINELASCARDLRSNIFLQQQNSFTGKNNSKHGVYIEQTGYWVFEGDDFNVGIKKEFFPFSNGIVTTSGSGEIIFEQNSQKPDLEKTIVLNFSGYNYLITITSEGVLDSYLQQ